MIYTLLPYDKPQLPQFSSLRPLLLDFFKTDILYLTHNALDGLSHNSWKTRKEEIRNNIIDNNIKLVLIDRTGDPCILDGHEAHTPNNLTMRAELNEFCRCLIITDDFTYYYQPNNNIVFFPYNLWLPATKSIHIYYIYTKTVYDTTIEKTRTLMCLNRNLEWHRIYLFSLLASKQWFNTIDYSFIRELGDRLDNQFNNYVNVKKYLTNEEVDAIHSYEHLLPIKLDYERDTPSDDISFVYSHGASSVDSPVYSRNAINLVTETTLVHGIALTEKTAKPIMAYQIPILVAPVGSSQFLEDIGIDMFSDYIPWKTWDNVEDHKTRMKMIVGFLDTIMNDPDKILETHHKFKPRLIKNKEYFHSKEFANLLTDQVSNFKQFQV
jgi:hypothetical protein